MKPDRVLRAASKRFAIHNLTVALVEMKLKGTARLGFADQEVPPRWGRRKAQLAGVSIRRLKLSPFCTGGLENVLE